MDTMKDIAIATFPNEVEARLCAQRLAAAGIRSVLVPLGGGPGVFGTATMLTHEVRVLAGDVEQARRLLREHAGAGTRPRRRYRKHTAPEQPC